MTDYLDVDSVTVPGQAFAVISVVSSSSAQKTPDGRVGLKIRGCFATQDEAAAHVRRLMKADNTFDIWVCDMYKWLALPPDPANVDNQEYSETFLNEMIHEYRESQLQAKQHFEERKRMAMEHSIDAVLTDEERLPPPPPSMTGGPSGSE
jgi:hypothetical protein